jgi:hypothetical protein
MVVFPSRQANRGTSSRAPWARPRKRHCPKMRALAEDSGAAARGGGCGPPARPADGPAGADTSLALRRSTSAET